MGLFDLFKKPAPQAPAQKPDRNEPCWCGSGRKYKKCHQNDDDARQQQAKACSLNCGST